MVAYLDPELFAPGRTVLDPACGDGQILIAAKAIKMAYHGMSENDALHDLYGVDIMRDNVDLCRKRLGGGTIVMGNTLDPKQALEGQTPEERELMLDLFDEPGDTLVNRKERVRGRKLNSVMHRNGPEAHIAETLF